MSVHETGQLDDQILHQEHALGIDTPAKRLVETALAVDRIFLDTAIITGQPERPERIFGKREWLGHLAARRLALEYGDQPLTTDFFIQMHGCFVQAAKPGEKSIVTEGNGGRGGQFVNGEFAPITCTEPEIEAVNGNPFTYFAPANSFRPRTGFIQYPTMTQQERYDKLGEICDAYNQGTEDDMDPYVVAARMQRSAIGLHMFENDFNGRTVRHIVNWSLENAGGTPSAIEDADGDLFLPEKTWIDTLKQGSNRYSAIKAKVDQGETDPITIFGLEKEAQKAMSLGSRALTGVRFASNGWHDHQTYRRFLESVSI